MFWLAASLALAAPPREPHRYFVSTSAFMIGNLLPDPPSFYQLNAGYRITPKDTLILEAITWTYHAPLGIPYGPDFERAEHDYPGHTRSVGVGLAYQRYWWKGLYSTVHLTPFRQTYYDTEGDKLGNGFQLFAVFRTGYHLDLFRKRLFLEPSVAVTSWPVETGQPEAFAAADAAWPRYFLFEPGLHVGVSF